MTHKIHYHVYKRPHITSPKPYLAYKLTKTICKNYCWFRSWSCHLLAPTMSSFSFSSFILALLLLLTFSSMTMVIEARNLLQLPPLPLVPTLPLPSLPLPKPDLPAVPIPAIPLPAVPIPAVPIPPVQKPAIPNLPNVPAASIPWIAYYSLIKLLL